MQRLIAGRRIFEAWSDEPWVVDGAAVRVSLVCFSRTDDKCVSGPRLDGQLVDEIYSDLTARRGGAGVDLTGVRRLPENAGVAFMGDTKGGAFDVAGDQAREWLRLPANPNGRTNADVLKPWMNGMDLTRRPAGKWIVDFGWTMPAGDAALYEEPFRWVKEHVYPVRQGNRRGKYWWRHVEPRPGMWRALEGLPRYIATPCVAKHRVFAWRDVRICPDHKLIVVARDDDTAFGILHSRFHELWSLRLCSWHGKGNDPSYTPTTTFETFPFPVGLTPNVPAASYAADSRALAIAEAARRLVELRDRWLNPPEWVEWVDEPVPGYPRRPVPRDEDAAKALRKRTLTNLYTPARSGLRTRTLLSMLPSPVPTDGPPTSPTTTLFASCWNSTAADWGPRPAALDAPLGRPGPAAKPSYRSLKGSVKPRRPLRHADTATGNSRWYQDQVGGGRRGGRRRASGRPRSVRPLAAGSRRRPEQRELGGGAGGKNSVSRARRCDQTHSGPRRPRRAAPRAKSGVAQVMSKIIPKRPSPSYPHHNPQQRRPGA